MQRFTRLSLCEKYFLSEGFKVWLWKNTYRVTVRQTPSKFTVMLLRYEFLSKRKIVESPYPNPTQVSLAYAFHENKNKVF